MTIRKTNGLSARAYKKNSQPFGEEAMWNRTKSTDAYVRWPCWLVEPPHFYSSSPPMRERAPSQCACSQRASTSVGWEEFCRRAYVRATRWELTYTKKKRSARNEVEALVSRKNTTQRQWVRLFRAQFTSPPFRHALSFSDLVALRRFLLTFSVFAPRFTLQISSDLHPAHPLSRVTLLMNEH